LKELPARGKLSPVVWGVKSSSIENEKKKKRKKGYGVRKKSKCKRLGPRTGTWMKNSLLEKKSIVEKKSG